MTKTVAFLLLHKVLMLDFAGPVEVFSTANHGAVCTGSFLLGRLAP